MLHEAITIWTGALSLKGCNASRHQRIQSSCKQWRNTKSGRFWIGKLLQCWAQATFNQSCCNFMVPSSRTFTRFHWLWSVCGSVECWLCICRTSPWKTCSSRENRGNYMIERHDYLELFIFIHYLIGEYADWGVKALHCGIYSFGEKACYLSPFLILIFCLKAKCVYSSDHLRKVAWQA